MVANGIRPERSEESVKPVVDANVAERFVVVALVVVMLMVERFASDDDAVDIKPPVFKTSVEVAFQLVAGVYGKAKVAQVAHESVPAENESGAETVVACTTPPAVTERSVDETASTRRLFARNCDEMYAKVEVAFVVVPVVTSRYESDDEAVLMKPAVFRMVVEVAVHEVAGVNGYPNDPEPHGVPVRVSAPDASSCAHEVPVPASAPNVGKPFASMASAATVEVVNVEGDEVARKNDPMIERNVHGFEVALPSVSASCGAVPDATVSIHCGDVVPIPRRPRWSRRIPSSNAPIGLTV